MSFSFVLKPADILRPYPIAHQYPDIMNPWSKVKTGGNRPRCFTAFGYLISGSLSEATVTGCIGRGLDAIPHR